MSLGSVLRENWKVFSAAACVATGIYLTYKFVEPQIMASFLEGAKSYVSIDISNAPANFKDAIGFENGVVMAKDADQSCQNTSMYFRDSSKLDYLLMDFGNGEKLQHKLSQPLAADHHYIWDVSNNSLTEVGPARQPLGIWFLRFMYGTIITLGEMSAVALTKRAIDFFRDPFK